MSPFQAATARLSIERLQAATRAREAAELEWREALTAAFGDRGTFTATDVAAAAGVSRARIYQVVNSA